MDFLVTHDFDPVVDEHGRRPHLELHISDRIYAKEVSKKNKDRGAMRFDHIICVGKDSPQKLTMNSPFKKFTYLHQWLGDPSKVDWRATFKKEESEVARHIAKHNLDREDVRRLILVCGDGINGKHTPIYIALYILVVRGAKGQRTLFEALEKLKISSEKLVNSEKLVLCKQAIVALIELEVGHINNEGAQDVWSLFNDPEVAWLEFKSV